MQTVQNEHSGKRASRAEIVLARCWNVLNEGKPFTPVMTLGAVLTYWAATGELADGPSVRAAAVGLAATLPIFAVFYAFDFPLFLRNYLWIPVVAFALLVPGVDVVLWLAVAAIYFFFTVFVWGTLYYRLRIGTPWTNFRHFWKLVLKTSDSTSGNAQEQLPKLLLLSAWWDHFRCVEALPGGWPADELYLAVGFAAGLAVYAWWLHRSLFDWRPAEYRGYARDREPPAPAKPPADRVVVIVIDGMRRDRFLEAHTPIMDALRREGTEFVRMETVYPARTVVCFSSMMTGTYPEEHGIRSNMVWRLGVRVETIFDALRKVGKKGRLLGIAHLIDAMGDDVDSVTAVMPNDEADRCIMERAIRIMEQERPDFLVVQLIATDQTGHSLGVFGDAYVQKIEEADALIGAFVDWLRGSGLWERTALVVCADHGQSDGIGGHAHLDEGERYVPFWMCGSGIARGRVVERRHSIVSLAATVAWLLGAPYPSHARGPVLWEALAEAEEGVTQIVDDDL